MPEQDRYLIEVFVRDHMGNRISCGKHQTLIDDWTLHVDVRDQGGDVQEIELEFKGKVKHD